MKNKMLENLEKKFNVATKLTYDLDILSEEYKINELEVIDENLPSNEIDSVFSLNQLKCDADLVHRNLRSLVLKGQRILDQVDTLDIAELKASQIDSLSNLQNTISNSLKMIIDIYKQIAEIEKMKKSMGGNKFENEGTSMVNTGTVVNNQIVFSGSPNDLLNILKPNSI